MTKAQTAPTTKSTFSSADLAELSEIEHFQGQEFGVPVSPDIQPVHEQPERLYLAFHSSRHR